MQLLDQRNNAAVADIKDKGTSEAGTLGPKTDNSSSSKTLDFKSLLEKAKKSLSEQQQAKANGTKPKRSKGAEIIGISIPLRLSTDAELNKTPYIKTSSRSGISRLSQGNGAEPASSKGRDSSLQQPHTKKDMVDELISSKKDPTAPKVTGGERKKQQQETAGAGWFDMKAPIVTPELKRDLRVLKLRNALDPKRFYRKDDREEVPKYFEVGTVIEGPTEFYSGRLTRKERKRTIVEELMADTEARRYFKRKYKEIQSEKQSGGKAWYKQQVAKRHRKKR